MNNKFAKAELLAFEQSPRRRGAEERDGAGSGLGLRWYETIIDGRDNYGTCGVGMGGAPVTSGVVWSSCFEWMI